MDSTLQETIRNAWLHKGLWHGLERRASFSSGEAKFDLKFAIHGQSNACFNYHVPFKVDNSAELARQAKSAQDKKMAVEFKAKQEKEAIALKAAQDLEKKAELEKQKLLKTLTPKANEAWNTFKKTKAYSNKIDEAKWKKEWIEKNLKQK